jgi:hypothetical protein
MCALCSDGYYEQGGGCAVCFETSGGSNGAKAASITLYIIFFSLGGAFLAFVLYLYLRDDGGEAVIKGLYWRWKARQRPKKKKVESETEEMLSEVASLFLAQNKGVWFRPIKFIILLTYLQVSNILCL